MFLFIKLKFKLAYTKVLQGSIDLAKLVFKANTLGESNLFYLYHIFVYYETLNCREKHRRCRTYRFMEIRS